MKEKKDPLPQAQIDFPDASKGFRCPQCGAYHRRYHRKFNANMALSLIFLYKNSQRGFIHLENEMIAAGFKRCGDASYLRWYHLIEAMDQPREDGSPKNGKYKITGRGMLFVEQKMKVQNTYIIYNGKHEGFEGPEISIIDALGKKFDYRELMSGDYTMYTQK